MLVYVSSFCATFTIEKMYRKMGPRNAYALGAAFALAACATFYFINHQSSTGAYAGSVLLGIGNSILMVVSVSLECDLIGENTESGAFVCAWGGCFCKRIAFSVIPSRHIQPQRTLPHLNSPCFTSLHFTSLHFTSLHFTSHPPPQNLPNALNTDGAMSFTDKLSNGIVVLAIQILRDTPSVASNDAEFVRMVTAGVPAAAALLGLATVTFFPVGARR